MKKPGKIFINQIPVNVFIFRSNEESLNLDNKKTSNPIGTSKIINNK
jgi:hypothetical protein